MRDLALLALISISIPLILRRPFYGVLVWCWISYMVPHRLAFSFMTEMPVAMIVAITFAAAYIASQEPKKLPVAPPLIWLLLFYAWMLITFLAHDKTPFAVYLGTKVAKIQIFTLLILALLTTRERIEQTLWVISFSIGFYAVKGGIFSLITGGGSRVYGPPGGFFEGNNELGLTMIMNIPLLFYLATTTNNKWLKLAGYAVIGFSAISILGTHSRGALVAICACLLFLWLKSRRKVLLAVIILAAAPLAVSFMPANWHQRMDTILKEDVGDYDNSVQGRINAWYFAFNLASDKLLGGGFDATNRKNFLLYAPNPEHFADSHSIYFQVLGKHGFPGLAIFLMMWLSTWRLGSRIRSMVKGREDQQWAGMLAGMLQVSMIAYATGGAFLGLAYFDLPYHLLITMVAIYSLVRKARQPTAGVAPRVGTA